MEDTQMKELAVWVLLRNGGAEFAEKVRAVACQALADGGFDDDAEIAALEGTVKSCDAWLGTHEVKL